MLEILRQVFVTQDIREGDSPVIYPYGAIVNVLEDTDDGVIVTMHGHILIKLFFGEYAEIERFSNA